MVVKWVKSSRKVSLVWGMFPYLSFNLVLTHFNTSFPHVLLFCIFGLMFPINVSRCFADLVPLDVVMWDLLITVKLCLLWESHQCFYTCWIYFFITLAFDLCGFLIVHITLSYTALFAIRFILVGISVVEHIYIAMWATRSEFNLEVVRG